MSSSRPPRSVPAARSDAALESIYEEVMWLLNRPNVTPGQARGWYTHIRAVALRKELRFFTGQVSQAAAALTGEPLVLEHFKRIQTNLSQLVERHRREALHDPSEFVALVKDNEQVHIVTRRENYSAMRAKGNYEAAGISLLAWEKLSRPTRAELWRLMLRGRVANADDYKSA
jgi:hypothetical protein